MKKLLIFGLGETATIAAEFFSVDSNERIAGFVVDDEYLDGTREFYGSPIFGLRRVLEDFRRDEYKIFVAVSYGKLNRERLRLYKLFLDAGFELARYISSKATIWRTAEIGVNCMVFEGNNIQHRALIEDNVFLWSGNHIGHGSQIGNSTYVSSHVCIAGNTKIQERCFLGINSSIIDNIIIEEDCFITAGSVVTRSAQANGIYAGNPAKRNKVVSALRYFKVSV